MNVLKAGVAGAMVLIVLLLVSCGANIINTGHRGVETRFGKVVSESLPEGFYWVNPLTSHIAEMDTRLLAWPGETQAYTQDVQQAVVHFVLNYRLDPTQAHIVFQTVGQDWSQKLVAQVVYEQIKRVLGQYQAVALIAQRNEAARLIEADVVRELGLRHVIVTGLQLTNIDYTPAFEKAVEDKQVATQNAIAEQNRTRQVEEKAKQTVLSAEATAKSMQIRAQALEQNAKLVEWEAVQKWDGKLPQYMLGDSTLPFIQVPAK